MRFCKIVAVSRDDIVFDFTHTHSEYNYKITTGFLIDGHRVVMNVDCGFKLKQHPQIETYIEFAYQIGVEVDMYPKEAALKEAIKEKIRGSYFVHLGLNTIPESTDEKLNKDMVVWILLLFAFDNVIDNSEGKIPHDKDLLRSYTALLSQKLKGKNCSELAFIQEFHQKGITPEESALATIPLRLADRLKNMTSEFLGEAKKYFNSSLEEMEYGSSMNLQSYMDVRDTSGAIDTVIRLAEGALPDYLATNNFDFNALNKKIVMYIWGVNDVGGAKEWFGHEPSYLKIQTKYHYAILKRSMVGVPDRVVAAQAFKEASKDLIELINKSNEEYFKFKDKVIYSIRSGHIFIETNLENEFDEMNSSEKEQLKESVLQDFLRRCEIRENLAVAGNMCTKISTRYFDISNPKKNVEILDHIGVLDEGNIT